MRACARTHKLTCIHARRQTGIIIDHEHACIERKCAQSVRTQGAHKISLHENGRHHDVEEEGVDHAVENQIPVWHLHVLYLPWNVFTAPTRKCMSATFCHREFKVASRVSWEFEVALLTALLHRHSTAEVSCAERVWCTNSCA